MNTNDMIYKIVAISVALVVVLLVLIPMVTAATENEITVTETGTNEATTTLGFDASNITLSHEGDVWAFDNDHSNVTRIVTSSAYIVMTPQAVTINGVAVTYTEQDTIIVSENTINTYLSGSGDPVQSYTLTAIANGGYVLTDGAENKIYGLWNGSGALINKNVNVIAIDSGTPVLEQYDGTAATGSVTITATESEQYPTAYEVSAVGTNGMLVAMLDYTYQTPVEMDSNVKTIVGVVPYLVVIGVLLAACGLFIRSRA